MMSKIRILRTIILISALATQLIYSENLLAKNEPTDPVKLFVQAFQSSFPEGKMANKPELLWKEDQSAFFIATRKNESTQGKKSSRLVAAVFIRQNDNSFKAIDISQVENLNMGKLGLNVRETYDSFALGPVKWIERSDGLYMLEIKTHAWKDGQRYTVSEPVVISAEGKPLWR